MAEHLLRQILSKAGVTHPGEQRAELQSMLQVQAAEIQAQFDRGQISRAVALDATRHVMSAALDEIVDDPALYRQARESGQIDAARQAIAGWDDNMSPEAAAEQRRQAFNVTMGHRVDGMFAAGQFDPASYHWVAEQIDPGAVSHARNFAGLNQPTPGDLDENPRPLNSDETNTVAALAFGSRNGMLADAPQQNEPDNAPEPSASDWSPARLEQFFDSREPKEGTD